MTTDVDSSVSYVKHCTSMHQEETTNTAGATDKTNVSTKHKLVSRYLDHHIKELGKLSHEEASVAYEAMHGDTWLTIEHGLRLKVQAPLGMPPSDASSSGIASSVVRLSNLLPSVLWPIAAVTYAEK